MPKSKAGDEAAKAEAETRAREQKRQADITAGKGKIDEAYSGFNDDYYGGYKDSYTGYYNPQVDDQYKTALDQLTAALSGRGILESSPGIAKLGELQKSYDQGRTQVANDADAASRSLRSNVENSKTDLYALNQSSADPEGIGARATGQATALAAPPSFSPLGSLFAGILSGFANSGQQQSQLGNPYASKTPSLYTASGSGSSSVVK
jgi:hypothetical protein